MENAITKANAPLWFWGTSGLGLIWNVYGLYQFAGTLRSTPESLMAMGMTADQALVYSTYPIWMTLAFAVGVLGGVAGCIALLFRRKIALPIFAASLFGYVILYVGDITEGVFAALGLPQVIVLSVVVLIAAGLLWLARVFAKRGVLV